MRDLFKSLCYKVPRKPLHVERDLDGSHTAEPILTWRDTLLMGKISTTRRRFVQTLFSGNSMEAFLQRLSARCEDNTL